MFFIKVIYLYCWAEMEQFWTTYIRTLTHELVQNCSVPAQTILMYPEFSMINFFKTFLLNDLFCGANLTPSNIDIIYACVGHPWTIGPMF